ncbi:MAG: sigma-70 family RNA polymerase sigma factor [Pirellulales bacterium]|nr:sigma-70 family RNA polymerase sigma factor [Pirellulales bacterium]
MPSDSSNRAAQAERWLADHGDALLAYAVRRTPDLATAEDMVQETLAAAVVAIASFEGDSTLLTWLTAILRRKIADFYRKRSREVPVAGDEERLEWFADDGHWRASPGEWGSDPAATAEAAEFQEALARCLGRLGPTLRSAFQLRVLDESTTEETCSILGISPTNLSVRLTRARLTLRECLERTWFGGT